MNTQPFNLSDWPPAAPVTDTFLSIYRIANVGWLLSQPTERNTHAFE